MFFFIPGPQFHDSVIMTELHQKLRVNYVLQRCTQVVLYTGKQVIKTGDLQLSNRNKKVRNIWHGRTESWKQFIMYFLIGSNSINYRTLTFCIAIFCEAVALRVWIFIGNSCLVGIKFLSFFFLGVGWGGGGGWVKQSVTTLCVERDTPEKPACNPIFIALF